MSKRVGFQFQKPRPKMPKLDITISSSQRIIAAGPSNMNQPRTVDESPTQNDEALFEDDDDEFLVLASQAVEQVEANAAAVISQNMNTQDLNMSYSHFRHNVRPVHSTQFNAIEEFDNDDDLFSNVPDYIPTAVPATATTSTEHRGQSDANRQNAQGAGQTREQKEQKEQRIQIEFYAEQHKNQKKQIETLKESLNKANQKCTTKEGESSTLRFEIESKAKEIERLRKERIDEAVEMERKYSEKIHELEKKLEEKESAIQFKSFEMSKKARKSLNDSIISESDNSSTLSEADLWHLYKLNTIHFDPSCPSNKTILEFMAAKGLEKYRGICERDFDTLNTLNALQALYNGAKAKQLRLLDNNMLKEFRFITNAFIDALRTYTARLPLRTATKYNAAMERRMITEEMLKPNTSPEKLCYELQMLAAISLICTDFPNTTQSLLFEKCDSLAEDRQDEIDGANRIGSFVDMLTDVMCTIGYSTNLKSHTSFVESASLLLVAVAKTFTPDQLGDSLVMNLFHAIVFCEPDLRSLNHLSEFLEHISKEESSQILNRLCTREGSSNVMPNVQQKQINRYSIETCPLQVFCCFLQVSFQTNMNDRSMLNHSNEVTTVAHITIRMITFLKNCFIRRVDWVFLRETAPNDTQNETQKISVCYCYVVNCIIVLLHFCLNSWVENHKIIDAKLRKTIATMSAQFLFDITKKHYVRSVLMCGGFAVKNRLQAIYDWLNQYMPILLSGQISPIVENALKAVNLLNFQELHEPQMMPSRSQAPEQMDTILSETFENFTF